MVHYPDQMRTDARAIPDAATEAPRRRGQMTETV